MLEELLDDVFGDISWSVAIILVAIILAVAGYFIKLENDNYSLKRDVVHSCAATPDPTTCSNNLVKAVNSGR